MLQIDLGGWNKEKEIGLITSTVGQGKTYTSIREIPAMLGIEPKDTLMCFPRVDIKNQCLREYEEFCTEYNSEEAGFENKVNLATCHLIGSVYRRFGYMPSPALVVVDEWHTVFAESNFAGDLLYFQQAFQSWVDNPEVTVICLTGTPTLPLKFVNECPFEGLAHIYNKMPKMPVRSIVRESEPRFKTGEIIIQQRASIESVLRAMPASEDNKQIVFVKGSIDRLIDLAANDDKSTWLCSTKSNSKVKSESGKLARDLMNPEHHRAFVSGYMPQGVNRVYLSSAYREGLNIHDESVQEIIIDGTNDMDIVQSFGRVRHDTKRLVVVVDSRKYRGIISKVKDAINLLEKGSEAAFEDYFNEQEQIERLKEEFEGDKKPCLIYEDKLNGKLSFNYWALYYWAYAVYSHKCARQYKSESAFWFGERLPSRDEYFDSMLGKYSDKPIRYNVLPYVRPATIERENQERIEQFDWETWGGRELFGEVAEEFKQAIDLKNKDYSTMAVSGIYKHFPQLFESKKRKKIDGKVPWVYELKSGTDLLGEII